MPLSTCRFVVSVPALLSRNYLQAQQRPQRYSNAAVDDGRGKRQVFYKATALSGSWPSRTLNNDIHPLRNHNSTGIHDAPGRSDALAPNISNPAFIVHAPCLNLQQHLLHHRNTIEHVLCTELVSVVNVLRRDERQEASTRHTVARDRSGPILAVSLSWLRPQQNHRHFSLIRTHPVHSTCATIVCLGQYQVFWSKIYLELTSSSSLLPLKIS